MAAPRDPSGPERAAAKEGSGGWRAHLQHSVSDFAWEFLRRNRDYRADYGRVARRPSAIDPRWGLRFGADPSTPAPDATIFWRDDTAPGLIIPFEMDRSPDGREGRSWLPKGRSRHADDGLHVRLPEGLQLHYVGAARPGGPLVVLLKFDQEFGLRARAIERLDRAVTGRPPPSSRLTTAQRERLAKSLLALDGLLAGDSYRTIATALFGVDALEREVWKSSSLRAVTIRLAQAGRQLMDGGYLKILWGGL